MTHFFARWVDWDDPLNSSPGREAWAAWGRIFVYSPTSQCEMSLDSDFVPCVMVALLPVSCRTDYSVSRCHQLCSILQESSFLLCHRVLLWC